MSKLGISRQIGIPVPAIIPSDVSHLVCYFGKSGFTPSYSQTDRIETPIASVPQVTQSNVKYFVFDTKLLPTEPDGNYDFYFTLENKALQQEGDFSPLVSVPLDNTAPVTLTQPVILA